MRPGETCVYYVSGNMANASLALLRRMSISLPLIRWCNEPRQQLCAKCVKAQRLEHREQAHEGQGKEWGQQQTTQRKGGDKREFAGEVRKGIVGEMVGREESEREGRAREEEPGRIGTEEAVRVSGERLNQVGKKGREEARAEEGDGERCGEEGEVKEEELEEMSSVGAPDIARRADEEDRRFTKESENKQRRNKEGSGK